MEQSLLAKESDVSAGDMVISIKSSDVQVGDVLVVSQDVKSCLTASGFRIRHGQWEFLDWRASLLKRRGDSGMYYLFGNRRLRIRVTDNQINSRICNSSIWWKNLKVKKTEQRHFIRMADKVVNIFLGAEFDYLLAQVRLQKAISFIGGFFMCSKNIHTCSLPGHKGRSWEMVIKNGDIEKYLEVDTFLFDKTGTITTKLSFGWKVLQLGLYWERYFRIGYVWRNISIILLPMQLLNKLKLSIEHEEMHGSFQYVTKQRD